MIRALAGMCAYCSGEGFFGVDTTGLVYEFEAGGLGLVLIALSCTIDSPDELDVISASGCLAGETKRLA